MKKEEKASGVGLGIEKLKENVETIVPANGLEEKLQQSQLTKVPLRVKLGFDPTAPDLHLGHAVVLKKLRQFQDLGHKLVIIIGDFTACIGDPTGRNKTRPPLTLDRIQTNAKTYLTQLAKIIDLSKTEMHFNSEWLDKLSMRDTIQLIAKMTLSQILQREDFSNRFNQNIPIHFHELLYPIVQGYDSLMIDADIEIGGTDQLFNCLVGRDIQSAYGKKPQIVICLPILKGTDGQQKMSKSLKNYIGITETPENIYGKLMSIPDCLIEEYAHLISNFSKEKLQTIHRLLIEGSVNPMNIKKELAYDIVSQFYGVELAAKSAEHFYKQVQSRDESVIDFTSISLQSLGLDFSHLTLIALCAALIQDKSRSELRRIIHGAGVTINSEKITDPTIGIEKLTKEDFKIKIGKRCFFQIHINGS